MIKQLIKDWDDLSQYQWNQQEKGYDLLFLLQRYNYSVQLAERARINLNYHNQAALSTWRC